VPHGHKLFDRLFSHTWTTISSPAAPRTLEEYLLHLQHFLRIFMTVHGLTINPAKCVFAFPSLKFLDHMVDEAGITPLPRHIDAVHYCLPPTDIKQLQRFLGLVNLYRRFLPSVAPVMQPLIDLLMGSPKVILWSSADESAFVAAKTSLVSAVPLCHPAPHAFLSLSVDALDSLVGGVLKQKVGRGWQPLVFFSKKLSTAEAKYSTFDRELLATFPTICGGKSSAESRARLAALIFFLKTAVHSKGKVFHLQQEIVGRLLHFLSFTFSTRG
jgi:hypothetical protein